MAHASRLISHCARRQHRTRKKWRNSRAFMVTTIFGLGRVGEHEPRVFLHGLLPVPLRQPDLDQAFVGLAGVRHRAQEDLAGLRHLVDLRGDDEVVVRTEAHVTLRLLVVRGQPVPHQLMRARAADAIHGEGEGGVLQSAVMTGAHEDPHHAVTSSAVISSARPAALTGA